MSTIGTMKRLLAILLLSVIGLLPFASALASVSAAENLPVCCRASGKHHCAIKSTGRKPGLQSNASKCPFAPAVSSATISISVFPVPAQEFSVEGTAHYLVAQVQASKLRIAFDRNSQKRGPPPFSLS